METTISKTYSDTWRNNFRVIYLPRKHFWALALPYRNQYTLQQSIVETILTLSLKKYRNTDADTFYRNCVRSKEISSLLVWSVV